MEAIIVIFIQAGIIYWCTWIAQKKHRDAPLAAFWATLFGIFAVIAYYIMDDKETNKDSQQMINEEIKQ